MRMPVSASRRFRRERTSGQHEWSVVDSEVSDTSSYPVFSRPRITAETIWSGVRSRTGR